MVVCESERRMPPAALTALPVPRVSSLAAQARFPPAPDDGVLLRTRERAAAADDDDDDSAAALANFTDATSTRVTTALTSASEIASSALSEATR